MAFMERHDSLAKYMHSSDVATCDDAGYTRMLLREILKEKFGITREIHATYEWMWQDLAGNNLWNSNPKYLLLEWENGVD